MLLTSNKTVLLVLGINTSKLLFGNKSNFSWNTIYDLLLPYFDNSLSRLDQVFLADYNGKLLYNFNPVNTSIAKSFDIKLLTPLLNDNLISYGLTIPNQLKYDQTQNIGKLPLRDLLVKNQADLLISKEKLGFNPTPASSEKIENSEWE